MKRSIFLSIFVSLFLSIDHTKAQDCFLGEVRMFAGNFAPRNWAYCDGQLLPISQNTALFSLLGTIYGGDGRTTFALPDFRGRVSMHPGHGPGLSSYNLGAKGGQETVTLTTSQMPSHSHSVSTVTSTGRANTDTPVNTIPAQGDNLSYTTETSSNTMTSVSNSGLSGGSQSHENRPPYLTVNYIICTAGTYPSRN